MSLPSNLRPEHRVRLAALPEHRRQLVLERAAILAEACGLDWPDADQRALDLEAPIQPTLF